MNNEILDRDLISKFRNYEPEIPQVVSDRIDKTLACLSEKEVLNKVNKKDNMFNTFYNKILDNVPWNKKVYWSIPMVVVITLIIVSCTVMLSNLAFADGNINKAIMSFIGKDNKLVAKYSTEINKSVIDKGISVTVDEIAVDSNSIIVKYTVKSNSNLKRLSENGQSLNIGFFLDLHRPYAITGMSYLPFTDDKTYNCFLDDYTYSALQAYSTDQLELEDKFKLGIKINSIGSKKGNWQFGFDVDKSLVEKVTKKVYPQKEFTYMGCAYSVEKVSISPISSTIDISILNGSPINDFTVIDDKGREITVDSVSLTKNNNSIVQRLKFDGYDVTPNKIIIIPHDKVENYDLKNGVTIDLGDTEQEN